MMEVIDDSREVAVGFEDAVKIFSTKHEMEITLYSGESVSVILIPELLNSLQENNFPTSSVKLLCLVMSEETTLDTATRQKLFFGLLLPMGLTLVKEDGFLLAPIFEMPHSHSLNGSVRFKSQVSEDIPDQSPRVACFCRWVGKPPQYRIHELVAFIREQLYQLQQDGDVRLKCFRLKSYSSIINKIFYRGKKLTDLFATTVSSQGKADELRLILEHAGGYLAREYGKFTNANGCLVYRYIRILIVTIDQQEIFFPVYYEITIANSIIIPRPHEEYELDRLRCQLNLGQINLLLKTKFTLERVISPSASNSEIWINELMFLRAEYDLTDEVGLIPLLSARLIPALGTPDVEVMKEIFVEYITMREDSNSS